MAIYSASILNYRRNGTRRWSLFFFVWVLLIEFECVKYFYATISIFEKKDALRTKKKCQIVLYLPMHNGHLTTTTTFLCPQGGRCGEMRLLTSVSTI